MEQDYIKQEYIAGIELKDTVELMLSEKYEERFIAEYIQTKIRYDKLHKMIVKLEAGTLDFEPKTPLLVLQSQASFMGQYLKQLEIRAELEDIVLPLYLYNSRH